MSEPRYVSPMLDGFSLGQAISDHSGVECYPAMRDDSEKRYIVKKISLPASQVQVEALLLTGVYKNADAVQAYYEDLAQGVRKEVRILDTLAAQRGFVPYNDLQIEPMESGIGYEVYLLSRYRVTLERYLRKNPMTHLGAVNLGIDMCAALAVCREAGWLYVDLKPENIYLFNDQEYRIGDLGFVSLDMLKYASLPDRYRSLYTAPEVPDAYSTLNATMDTYALGLVLYQVYNGGKPLFTTAEERDAWLEKLRNGEAIEAPVCADADMAAIITKAIALDPADRWQTPAEMGHALISYMQRNGADDIPILPPVVEEPVVEEEPPVEEIPAEESVEEPAVEETPAEEPTEEPSAEETPAEEPVEEAAVEEAPTEDPIEEPAVEETPAEEPVEEPIVEETPAAEPAAEEEPQADWIDLMDAFLAEEEEDGTAPETEEAEPTLRELLGNTEELLSDAEKVMVGDVTAETADILTVADELIEHEAPTPVIVPEPIDVPIPEPIPLEPPVEEQPEEESAEEEPPAEEPAPADEEEAPKPTLLKKLLRTVTALAVIAGLAFGAWYYYQNFYLQTIDAMSVDGTSNTLTVTVDTAMDESKLTVICKDTYGNAQPGKLENGVVTFEGLVPGSQYIITLEAEGFHKLLGTTSATYSTPAETKLIHLTAVTGQEAGTAIVSFGIEGLDSEEWTVTWSAEGIEPQSLTFTGHTVTIPELTVGTEYTFTLTAPEEVLLVGENTVVHTASELVQARNLGLADYADGVITVSWSAPADVTVDRWIVRCTDGAGYDQLQEVTGTTASFADVTEGGVYTVEVTASNMTLGIRAEITAEASAVSGFRAELNGSTIELSWNAVSDVPWAIECSANGSFLQILTTEENTAAYGPAVPGCTYTFTIKPINVDADLPGGTATVETPAASVFSANKLDSDSIIVEMFDVPKKNNWTYSTLQRAREKDTFSEGGSLALLYTVTKPYSFDSGEFETIFAIRDSEGNLVSASGRTQVWDDMWDNGYCTETVSNLPTVPGDYTLTIYIANGVLTELPFTIK